jgi:hypothetical protein
MYIVDGKLNGACHETLIHVVTLAN